MVGANLEVALVIFMGRNVNFLRRKGGASLVGYFPERGNVFETSRRSRYVISRFGNGQKPARGVKTR